MAAGFSTPTGCFVTAIEVDFTTKSDRIPGIGSGAGIGATSEVGDYASAKFKAVVSHPMPCNTVRLRAELAESEARVGRFALQSAMWHEKKS